MRIRSNLKGTSGFVTAYNRLIRFRYMISDKAKDRVRILAFWERYGTDTTTEAFDISKRTLERWQKILNESQGKLEALNPKSTTPKKRRSRSIQSTISEQIIELRTNHPRLGKDKLHTLLVNEGYRGSVSTIGRILNDLKERGLLPNPKPLSFYAKGGIHREKTKQYKKKLRRPQSVRVLELDTIVRFIDGTKRYILTAVDTKTRTAFAGVYTNHGSQSASDFLKHCLQVLPDCPTYIQTDNGSEFAKYFHETATRLNLIHYHTYPRTPKMNAHVERFNRTLQEEWIIYHRALLRDNVSKANTSLIEYLLWYNSKRPHHALGLRSPFQCMMEGLEVRECQRWWTSTSP
ncbi:MAG: Integrase core domain protein [Parcubacteria bacterium OLB19]|nr:MAG: Integrase core domain protein [Parcubacteria bacterium OLB19]